MDASPQTYTHTHTPADLRAAIDSCTINCKHRLPAINASLLVSSSQQPLSQPVIPKAQTFQGQIFMTIWKLHRNGQRGHIHRCSSVGILPNFRRYQ